MPMGRIRIDPDAYGLLMQVKDEMRARGIKGASFSDAIRYTFASRDDLKRKLHLVG